MSQAPRPPGPLLRSTERKEEIEEEEEVKAVEFVASAKALKNVPYEEQGDPYVNTPQALATRANNRYESTVIAVLQAFWDSVVTERRGQVADMDVDDDVAVLTRDDYCGVYEKIARGLAETTSSAGGKKKKKVSTAEQQALDEEARQQAELAWTQDTSGDVLSFARGDLFDSIFQLVDVWSKGTSPQDYSTFSRNLLYSTFGIEAESGGYWRRQPGCACSIRALNSS